MTEQATAPSAPQSPIATIKAFLSTPQTTAEAPEAEAEDAPSPSVARSQALPEQEAPAAEESATREDADEPEAEADEPEDDAQDVEVQLSTLDELADATGLEKDKLLDLQLPTKIDGKEGTATIRDLLKSYQLDGHINQKLAALDTDRKTFEAKRTEQEKAATERIQQLDQGIAILENALVGEFQSVDWQKLQAENPAQFNALYVSYQQKFGQLQQLAQRLQAEKQTQMQAQQAKAKAWLEEQQALIKAKIPEWSDNTQRAKEQAAIADYLKGYGISKDELSQIQDHRYALVVRDAWKWAELQKQKPVTLKKVKAAPKLLKPGTKQSQEARAVVAKQEAMNKLKRSGRVSDAAKVIKGLIS